MGSKTSMTLKPGGAPRGRPLLACRQLHHTPLRPQPRCPRVPRHPASPPGFVSVAAGCLRGRRGLSIPAVRVPARHPLRRPLDPHPREEHVRAGLQIVSSLVLLGGAPFLQQYGADLAALLAGYIGTVNERGTLLLLPPLDLLLTLYPTAAPPLLAPALQRLLALLLVGSEPPNVVANALGVIARLVLVNPPASQQLLATAGAAGAPGGGGGPDAAAGALAALWVDAFDSIAAPLARKLSALALCALLALPTKAQLAHAGGIVGHVTAVWHEVEASGDGGTDGTLYCSPIYQASAMLVG
jgi:hypothetical protein